jgi:hypothetical protein
LKWLLTEFQALVIKSSLNPSKPTEQMECKHVHVSLNLKRTLELKTSQQKLQHSRQKYSALCAAVAVLKFIYFVKVILLQ